MPHFDLPLSLQLLPGQCLPWDAKPSARLTVLSGRVWLTHRGDAEDHFLHVGDVVDLHAHAGTLIGGEAGLGPVCVRIEAHSPAPAPRRATWRRPPFATWRMA